MKSLWMLLSVEDELAVVKIAKVAASNARVRPGAAESEFMSTAFMMNVFASLSVVTSLPAFPNNDTQLKSFIPI